MWWWQVLACGWWSWAAALLMSAGSSPEPTHSSMMLSSWTGDLLSLLAWTHHFCGLYLPLLPVVTQKPEPIDTSLLAQALALMVL